ncbi:CLC_0170 family protein [Ammoniphilus sp. 3BR4]|uniref:CLC_0170 family protein n=1 Tax=Ammoniphilus sp. 3BR4 TaxID=3158265 RepID=UPI0034669754
MTIAGITIGYLQYVIFLLLGTGGLVLYFDVKAYRMSEMKKEQKAARFLGVFNLSLGALIWVSSWVIEFFQ